MRTTSKTTVNKDELTQQEAYILLHCIEDECKQFISNHAAEPFCTDEEINNLKKALKKIERIKSR